MSDGKAPAKLLWYETVMGNPKVSGAPMQESPLAKIGHRRKTDILVLFALASHAHNELGKAWPGNENLAVMVGVSKTETIRASLKRLEADGLIRKVGNGNGRGRAAEYEITPTDLMVNPPSPTDKGAGVGAAPLGLVSDPVKGPVKSRKGPVKDLKGPVNGAKGAGLTGGAIPSNPLTHPASNPESAAAQKREPVMATGLREWSDEERKRQDEIIAEGLRLKALESEMPEYLRT